MSDDAVEVEEVEVADDATPTIVDMVKAAVASGQLGYDDLAGLNALASGELKEAMKKAEAEDLQSVHDLIRKHKFAYTDVRLAFATRHTKRETTSCPLCKSASWETVKAGKG
jgi:hypothetical protein